MVAVDVARVAGLMPDGAEISGVVFELPLAPLSLRHSDFSTTPTPLPPSCPRLSLSCFPVPAFLAVLSAGIQCP